MDEKSYYSRQQILPEIGSEGQRKLKNGRVLVVGAGGLGSSALSYLASAGVGTIGICEDDVLDTSNLHRQIIYDFSDVGKKKNLLAKETLSKRNPYIEIETYEKRFNANNALKIARQYDLLLDCSDNFATKFLLNDVSYFEKIPLVRASIYQFEGQLEFYDPQRDDACLRCVWNDPFSAGCTENCTQAGVLGSIAGLFGIMQAIEATKYIIGLPNLDSSVVLVMNLLDNTSYRLSRKRNRLCNICGDSPRIKSIEEKFYVSSFVVDSKNLFASRGKGGDELLSCCDFLTYPSLQIPLPQGEREILAPYHNGLLSVEQAWDLIDRNPLSLGNETIPLFESLNRWLSNAIHAPIPLPIFDNSAVDGFAVRRGDLINPPTTLPIAGVIAAGDVTREIAGGETHRIMTGALLPIGCDAVIKQEDVSVSDGYARFSYQPEFYANIRRKGEDVGEGASIMSSGTILKPSHIGLLAALGIGSVEVKKVPRVSIIATGSELLSPGEELSPGRIYASNGIMLQALLRASGIHDAQLIHVHDDLDATKAAIQVGLESDLLLVLGGVSVGQYDFVKAAFNDLGVEQIFWRGKWRPGKPLYFGKTDGCKVFGVPGNPVAVFACYHMFIKRMFDKYEIKYGSIVDSFTKPAGYTMFARAVADRNGLNILRGQGSHHMLSMSQANALCIIEEHDVRIGKNDIVKYVHI